MKIIEDFLKIKEALGLSDELELHIKFDWNEGFYRAQFPAVMVGVKGGYNRTLLVHECLHAGKMSHLDMIEASSVGDYWDFSKKVEKQIFAFREEE